MNRDRFIKAAEQISTELKKRWKRKDYSEDTDRIRTEIKDLVSLCSSFRGEGVTFLEDRAYSLEMAGRNRNDLSDILMHVVNGTDPETLEEIFWYRYFTEEFDSPLERLIYLLDLRGALAIQTRENPDVLKDILISMSPGIRDMEFGEEAIERAVGKACQGSVFGNMDEGGRIIPSVVTGVFRSLCSRGDEEDRDLEKVLKNISFTDLKKIMKVLPGELRERIFWVIPSRYRMELAVSLKLYGIEDEEEIIKACCRACGNVMEMFIAGRIGQGQSMGRSRNTIYELVREAETEKFDGDGKENAVKEAILRTGKEWEENENLL